MLPRPRRFTQPSHRIGLANEREVTAVSRARVTWNQCRNETKQPQVGSLGTGRQSGFTWGRFRWWAILGSNQ